MSSRLATVLANGRMFSWAAVISAGIAVVFVLYTQRIMSESKCSAAEENISECSLEGVGCEIADSGSSPSIRLI